MATSRCEQVLALHRDIESRILQFLAQEGSLLEWLKPAVREHGFLPLYVGWVATLGIRPDGSFVKYDTETDPEELSPLSAGFWQRVALCEGVKKYPELLPLLPERPPTAITCDRCGGSGGIGDASFICHCGGIGWIVPGVPKDAHPG
jgi:hypothetical protein